jgi:hypothetical protein
MDEETKGAGSAAAGEDAAKGAAAQDTKTQDPPKADPHKEESDFDKLPDWAKKEIHKLRDGEAKHRTKAKDLEGKVSEYETKEQQRERERLEKEGDTQKLLELEKSEKKSLQEKLMRQDLKLAAQKLGALDPADIVSFVPVGDIKTDKHGEVTNADDLVESLKKSKPYLFKPSEAAKKTPEGTDSKKEPEGGAIKQLDALKMSDAEYVKAKDALFTGTRIY